MSAETMGGVKPFEVQLRCVMGLGSARFYEGDLKSKEEGLRPPMKLQILIYERS